MKKIHLVNHTHWDREWYFTLQDSLVLSDIVFSKVINELENNPTMNFEIDGQASVVEEYLRCNPNDIERVKKLIENKQLFIGPWYTQTDCLLVTDESILKNLLIGIREANKMGGSSMCGYLPDTFGFNAQLPTLLNHAGINSFFSWRGIDYGVNVDAPYYIWKGLSGKKVVGSSFPYGYSIGAIFKKDYENPDYFANTRIKKYVDFICQWKNFNNILMPVGGDQKNITPDFVQYVEKLNELSDYEILISDYQSFADNLIKDDSLVEYKGDLRAPRFSRIHRTIGGIRMPLKLENFDIEQKMIRRIEPLAVISKSLGIHLSTEIIVEIWKKVLQNHAHDSIGGCVSDDVTKDILQRIKEANELADGVENYIKKYISESLKLEYNEILVFNTDPYPFEGYKEIEFIIKEENIRFLNHGKTILIDKEYMPGRKNIKLWNSDGDTYINEDGYYKIKAKIYCKLPAMGYKVISFEESDSGLDHLQKMTGKNYIENSKYRFEFNNGSIDMICESNVYKDFIRLKDMGNGGDTYDFSPIAEDKEIILSWENFEVYEYYDYKIMLVRGSERLPKNLENRLSNNEMEEVSYELKITLIEGENAEFNLVFNNTIYSHRLRLSVNTNSDAGNSFSQIQNGFYEYDNKIIDEDWKNVYEEKPVNIYNMDKSASVTNEKQTLTIFTNGLKEYEKNESRIDITLLSTTNQLGKPNLLWRPGRASGDTTNAGHIMMPTPLAEEIGLIEYKFGILVSDGPINEELISKESVLRLSQDISYQKQELNKFVNRLDNKIWYDFEYLNFSREYSLFENKDDVFITSIYPAFTNSSDFVIRYSNPTKKDVNLRFEGLKDYEIKYLDAAENEIETDSIIRAYDYKTISISKKA